GGRRGQASAVARRPRRPHLRGQQVIQAAAFVAWLGPAMIVLSDGRRGLALGLALTTVAFVALAWAGGDHLAAAAILFGGAVAAIRRSRIGPDVWGLMP